jgi:hypothetical protein
VIEPIPFFGLLDMEEKRFCTSCQRMRSEAGGAMVGEKIRRWLCLDCQQRKSERQYENKQ